MQTWNTIKKTFGKRKKVENQKLYVFNLIRLHKRSYIFILTFYFHEYSQHKFSEKEIFFTMFHSKDTKDFAKACESIFENIFSVISARKQNVIKNFPEQPHSHLQR